MANGTQDREDIDVVLGGTTYTIKAPKGLKDDEIITRAMSQDKEFADAYRSHKMFGSKPIPGAPGGLPEVPNLTPDIATEEAYRQDPRLRSVKLPPGKSPGDVLEGENKYMKESGELVNETLGAMAGGKLVRGALKAAPWLLKAGGTAAGIGAGTAVGNLAVSGSPKEAASSGMKTGAGALAFEGLGKYIPATFKGLLGPILEKAPVATEESVLANQVSKHGDDLLKVADAEEGLRKSISEAPKIIRKNIISPAYQAVTGGEVDLLPVGEKASEASKGLLAHKMPGEVAKVKQLNELVTAAKNEIEELRALPEDEVGKGEIAAAEATLERLKDSGKVSIQDAIQLRSAIRKFLSKSKMGKVPAFQPGETWQAMKSVNDTLTDGINEATDAPGKAALKKADGLYHEFAEEFMNKNSPLRAVVNTGENMRTATLKTLLKPENIDRAVTVLKKYGMTDQADALRKIADMPNLKGVMKDYGEWSISRPGFEATRLSALKQAEQERVAAAVKELKANQAKRWGWLASTTAVTSGLYGMYKKLSGLTTRQP